ncbi:MAG: ABC transporter ATP-binding protein [Planctomycetota bacterium]
MILCSSVGKTFGQVAALGEVSFELDSGVVGLVGRNGAGKTTLMRILVGLSRPSVGEVKIDGRSPTSPAARRLVGYCPDFDSLYDELTGAEFVAWMLRLDGVGAKAAKHRAREVLDELGLDEAMDRRIRTYSKGMRQRVRLGQALAHRPKAVLLDEPMTGLDPVARRELSDEIHRLGQTGHIVLVSSHVLHELEALADRVLLVHQGRLIADGPVRDLRAKLEDRPHQLELKSSNPRRLAERLVPLAVVDSLTIDEEDDSLRIETSASEGLFRELTEIGADSEGLIEELRVADEGLDSVFSYLVARRGLKA